MRQLSHIISPIEAYTHKHTNTQVLTHSYLIRPYTHKHTHTHTSSQNLNVQELVGESRSRVFNGAEKENDTNVPTSVNGAEY